MIEPLLLSDHNKIASVEYVKTTLNFENKLGHVDTEGPILLCRSLCFVYSRCQLKR